MVLVRPWHARFQSHHRQIVVCFGSRGPINADDQEQFIRLLHSFTHSLPPQWALLICKDNVVIPELHVQMVSSHGCNKLQGAHTQHVVRQCSTIHDMCAKHAISMCYQQYSYDLVCVQLQLYTCHPLCTGVITLHHPAIIHVPCVRTHGYAKQYMH